jgi:HEAT repeat protein
MSNDRVAELKALGKSKDVVGAVDKLAKALDSMDDQVREATVSSLRELLAAKDFPKLYEDPKTPLRTRRNVLKALRYLKDPKYTPMVVKALGDADAGLRSEAALVLSVYGAADAEGALIKVLGDAEKDVRYYAADALGGLKTDAAKQAVLERQKVEKDQTVLFALQQAEKKQR